MRLCILLIVFVSLVLAQNTSQADRYPTVRVVIAEAETTTASIQPSQERQRTVWRVANVYARAGYLDDAGRLLGPSGRSVDIWKAQVLYGDLNGAEKDLESIEDPEMTARIRVSLADLLWKMGNPNEARIRLEAARRFAAKIPDPEHQKQTLRFIELGLMCLSEEPPYRVSPVPEPEKALSRQSPPIHPFPITTEGFRIQSAQQITNQLSADSEFMRKLYGRMEAGDREGLLRIVDDAPTPFQKALGLAGIEHILLVARQPEAAEQYARRIPESNPNCLLAKAEAMSAAATAWSQAGNDDRATGAFAAAIDLAKSVSDLNFGRVSVIVSVASAQARVGMVASSAANLALAKDLAIQLPLRPDMPGSKTPVAETHYRDEAYMKILPSAITAHNIGLAREVANQWKAADSKAAIPILQLWMDSGETDEAIVLARSITEKPERVLGFLAIAHELLNRAGAPLPELSSIALSH
jgi:tetratricopeptide (TPR) repeat protein